MPRSAIALLLSAPLLLAAPVPKEIRAKAAPLDGTWEIVELRSGLADVTNLNPWVWVIDGEKLTIFNREKDGTLQLNDPRMTTTLVRPTGGGPEDVDYVRDDGKNPLLFKGLVAVDGNELVICFSDPNNPRPAERKSGQTVSYYRFKRIKDK